GFHLGASGLEDRQRFLVEEFHPDLFEDAQRGVVDRLELIGAQHLHRLVGIAHLPPGQLTKSTGRAALPVPVRIARHESSWFFVIAGTVCDRLSFAAAVYTGPPSPSATAAPGPAPARTARGKSSSGHGRGNGRASSRGPGCRKQGP